MAGWFEQVDSDIFDAILSQQHGDVLEIGAYVGDSAIPMGRHIRPDESLVVCDLWEGVFSSPDIDPKDHMHYSGLTLDRFLQNWDAVYDWRPELVQGDSLTLDLTGREFRFAHIDGCHMYEYVSHDIRNVAGHVHPDGVIVLDDYRREHVPGVAAATWGAVSAGIIFPFLTSTNKLYATANPAAAGRWLSAMSRRVDDLGWNADTYSFPTYEVLMVRA